MLDFSGKVVWVTGGTSGIGLEVTLTLARLGARVFTNSRRPPEGDVLQRAGIEWGACDVSDWSAVRETAKRVESATGAIDVLISNAAVLRPLGDTWKTDPEEWARAVQINLVGAYNCIRAVLPGMTARDRGNILNVSSGSGGVVRPGWSAYSTSKAALNQLTRSVAHELQETRVRINAIYPYTSDTPMFRDLLASPREELPDHRREYFLRLLEDNEVQSPEAVARCVVWLVSDLSGHRSGEILPCVHGAEWVKSAEQAFGEIVEI